MYDQLNDVLLNHVCAPSLRFHPPAFAPVGGVGFGGGGGIGGGGRAVGIGAGSVSYRPPRSRRSAKAAADGDLVVEPVLV